MVRCNNCGWGNPSDRMMCEKCNAPLESAEMIDGGGMRLTVRETGLKDEGAEEKESKNCPDCGYPLMPKAKFCPQCGTSFPMAAPAPATPTNVNRFKKTVMPGKHARSRFSLTMLPEEDEKIGAVTLDFSGRETILNRANTEPDNETITSRKQAVVTHEDNKWYIQDLSDFQTTYVRSSDKIEIKAGDIIVLGDRRFRFNN